MKSTSKSRMASRESSAQAMGVDKPVPSKWRWHYRALLHLRDRLRAERGEQLAAAEEMIKQRSMDMADSASDEFDHALALSKLSAEQDMLFEVEAALARIMAGTYGVCEQSGEKIPEERLRALPWARFTRDVEECLEKRGGLPRQRLTSARTVRPSGQLSLSAGVEEEESEERPSVTTTEEKLSRLSLPTDPGRVHPKASGRMLKRPRRKKRRS